MSNELVSVATFSVTAEAELARQALEAAGIAAVLDGETTASTLSYIGTAIGGVRVLVRQADQESARRVLQSIRHDNSTAAGGSAAWICPNCSVDVSADFDVCWQCGSTRDGTRDPTFSVDELDLPTESEASLADVSRPGHATRADLSSPPPDANNPYRSPAVVELLVDAPESEPEVDTSEGDALAVRAWRAAVLSPFLCPPLLTIYSVWLVVRIAVADVALSRLGKSRFYLALLLNVVLWAAIVIVIRRFYFS